MVNISRISFNFYIIIIVYSFSLIVAEINTNMSTPTLQKVFVYGTLKKGEPNHQWFSKANQGYYRFLYEAKTKEKFPLIIATKYNVPFILYSPGGYLILHLFHLQLKFKINILGNGTHVIGEVYEVDDKVLADLDILEEHPVFYTRDLNTVTPLNSETKETRVWIYFIKKFRPELLHQQFYERYSNFDSHGKKYIARYLRGEDSDFKTLILDK